MIAPDVRGLKVGDRVVYAGPHQADRFALKDPADAHKAFEARATPGSAMFDYLTEYPQEFAVNKTAITSPELAPPVGPFSQAIEAGGFLYISGQVGQDPDTGRVV